MPQRKILVVEDEHDIAQLLAMHLNDAGFEVGVAGDGNQALTRALSSHWDLIVLDLRLPGIDGLEVCRRLRQGDTFTPIMMLTSKSSELDRVLGLELGADDYLTKPFSIMEAVARIKAIFRRVDSIGKQAADKRAPINLRHVSVLPDQRRVTVDGRDVELTAKEFDLLLHFARNPNRVFRRSELLDQVWGYGHDGYEHTVNSHINRLRNKIEPDPAHPSHIVTVWGVGYKLETRPAA